MKDDSVAEIQDHSYSRPPITEAVIELSIGGDASDRELQKVVRGLRRSYPNVKPYQSISVNIDATGGNIQQQQQGYRLSSVDEADIVLVRPKSVATARLAPYPGWPTLRDAALAVWRSWRRFTPHHPVSRLGIRYINRIDVPVENQPVLRLEEFLAFYPQIPPIVDGPMSGYLMQITLPLKEAHWSATVSSTLMVPSPVPNCASILLDIDVFRHEAIPAKDDDVWSLVNQARVIKNTIFEACVTDKSRELFQK